MGWDWPCLCFWGSLVAPLLWWREDRRGRTDAALGLLAVVQALQAPACHENLVKVGGYILGEFGNLIAGDPRSR